MSDVKTNDRCVLCLDEKRSPVQIKCGHSFCHECLEVYKTYQNYSWAKRCPICRSSMKDKKRTVKIKSLSSNTNTGNSNPTNTTNESHTPGALTANHSIPLEQVLILEEYMAMATDDSSFHQSYRSNYSEAMDDSEDEVEYDDRLVDYDDDDMNELGFYTDSDEEVSLYYFSENDNSNEYDFGDEDTITADEDTEHFSINTDEIISISDRSSDNSLMSLRSHDIINDQESDSDVFILEDIIIVD